MKSFDNFKLLSVYKLTLRPSLAASLPYKTNQTLIIYYKIEIISSIFTDLVDILRFANLGTFLS